MLATDAIGSGPANRGRSDSGVLASSRLSLRLLQSFALSRDGHPVDLPPVAQRVVAFLALERRRVDRMLVSGKLWIDSTDEQASASLRTTLWRLGQICRDVVEAYGTTLELGPGVSVDLIQAAARANLLVQQPEEHCEKDVELLGASGDLLPDWYDDWVLIERERFRQLRLHALESLCRALTAAGSHAQAVLAGLAAIGIEPLRESSNRALIAAYIAEGNRSEALRQYQLFKQRLDEELGLTPSPRMEMLMARLRSS
jgi:DNA-binding SARP family transcriptional activator